MGGNLPDLTLPDKPLFDEAPNGQVGRLDVPDYKTNCGS